MPARWKEPIEVDCLRLDFQRDAATGLPTYSVAVIGQGRRQVRDRVNWLLARLQTRPYKETWMSAPDVESDTSNDPARRDEMDQESEERTDA